MREVTFEESRKIQLDILVYFDEWCKKHDLHYSLAGGTLLGALRHKGFIPWDDDIDVFMERTSYEKFINIYKGRYKLITNRNWRWFDGYSRLTDEKTMVCYDNGSEAFHGLWMAILPIDNFPDDGDWIELERRLSYVRRIGQIKQLKKKKAQSKKMK